jgi:hypothetical protein
MSAYALQFRARLAYCGYSSPPLMPADKALTSDVPEKDKEDDAGGDHSSGTRSGMHFAKKT